MTAPGIADLVIRLVAAGFDATAGRNEFGDRVVVRTEKTKAEFIKAARLGIRSGWDVTTARAGVYIIRRIPSSAAPVSSSS